MQHATKIDECLRSDADERKWITYPPVAIGAAQDSARALDELQAWIERNPVARSAWTIDRLHGMWRVGLMSDAERLSASQDLTLAGAIRKAITIADSAGYL